MSNVVLSKSFQRVKIRYLFIFNDDIILFYDSIKTKEIYYVEKEMQNLVPIVT